MAKALMGSRQLGETKEGVMGIFIGIRPDGGSPSFIFYYITGAGQGAISHQLYLGDSEKEVFERLRVALQLLDVSVIAHQWIVERYKENT